MSQSAKDAAWNAWWGTLSSADSGQEGKRSANYLFRATRDNINKLSTGKRDYIEGLQTERLAVYNPYTDSGADLTGYHRQEADPFKVDFSGVAEAHDNKTLFNIDPLASAVSQNVTVDNATGVTTLNTSVYGEAPTPDLGKNFFQIGLGVADSIMDQFTSIQEANAYSPSGYAANGFGNTDGLFAGFKGNAADRRDMFGREIKTEGIQDYVEEGGRRYNIDFAGNFTEVNPFTGQPLETAGGMNGFYQASGWDSGQGMWDNATVSNVYGTASVAENANIWGSSGASMGSEGLNNYYQTSGWDSSGQGGWKETTMTDLYGAGSTGNNWNLFGTAPDNNGSGGSGWYGAQATDPSNGFFGNNTANEQNNWHHNNGNIYASHGHHHANRTDDDNRSNWFFSQT